MKRAGPRHAYAETVQDNGGPVNGRVLQQRVANRNGAPVTPRPAVAPRAEAKNNVDLIADAAAKLKITYVRASSQQEMCSANTPRRDEDVIIAVMGLTGVGKSSFIKQLSDDQILIGHDLNSCKMSVRVLLQRG